MILLNFDNKIKGTATVDKHDGWIVCQSINFGVGRAVKASSGKKARDASAPSFSEITFTRQSDVASPDLFMQAIAGKSLGKADVHFVSNADNSVQVSLKIELHDAMITSYTLNGSSDSPTETIAVNFAKISKQFDSFNGAKVTTGTPKKWDLTTNKTF